MDETKNTKNTISGTGGVKADVSGGGVRTDTETKKKPGALVEDESLSGTITGGVVPKDPGGHAVEGEATDARENPES